MEIIIEHKTRKPVTTSFAPRNAEHVDVASAKITQGKECLEMCFSKYSTESEWYCDATFRNGMPVFCHGEGSRSCMKRAAQNEIKEAIEAYPLEIQE